MTAPRRWVLDASALLAVLQLEQGADRIETLLEEAVISSVNLAEVLTKAAERGLDLLSVQKTVTEFGVTVAPFAAEDAAAAADLRLLTRPAGLSLADRACLALALRHRAIAVTTDRAWARLDIGVAIEVVR